MYIFYKNHLIINTNFATATKLGSAVNVAHYTPKPLPYVDLDIGERGGIVFPVSPFYDKSKKPKDYLSHLEDGVDHVTHLVVTKSCITAHALMKLDELILTNEYPCNYRDSELGRWLINYTGMFKIGGYAQALILMTEGATVDEIMDCLLSNALTANAKWLRIDVETLLAALEMVAKGRKSIDELAKENEGIITEFKVFKEKEDIEEKFTKTIFFNKVLGSYLNPILPATTIDVFETDYVFKQNQSGDEK